VTVLDTRETGDDSLIFSTYLGGNGFDFSTAGIAVDNAGRAYVVGGTNSTDFPTRNPFQGELRGRDAFVSVIEICDSKQQLNNGNDKKCNDSNGNNISNNKQGSSVRPAAIDAVDEINKTERGMTFLNRLRRRYLAGW